jgi:hypothetical protein
MADPSTLKIPFTDEGWIEGTTSYLAPGTPAVVWPKVLANIGGLSEADRILASGDPPLARAPAAYHPGIHLTDSCRAVAIQGGWWYRGVTSVAAHPEGSEVTYTCVNVAPGWTRWLAHFFQARSHRRELGLHRPR